MERLKELVTNFFKNMGARISYDGVNLSVDSVEEEFEREYGKRTPYKISFIEKDINPRVEIFCPGSKMFNMVLRSLDQNVATTILKINLDIDPLKQIEGKLLLKNCQLKEIKKDYENNFFSRFTFKTTFKYLNKNEESINEVFVHGNKIVRGNLKDYEISAGELKEVDTKYMEKDYLLAKENIRELIKPQVKEISSEISKLLEVEIDRIKSHYLVQKKELNDSVSKSKIRLKELEKADMTPENMERINKLQKVIDGKTLSESLNKIQKEEDFAIKDEKQKYAVSMNTKLLNTTVLYYLMYQLKLTLVDGSLKKDFQIGYDPLTNEILQTECFSCNKKMKEVALCKSGHVCCPDCLFRCVGCGGLFCKECLKDKCNSCAGPVCKDCLVSCKGCKKTFCKQHIREESFSGESYCLDCMGFCSLCSSSCLKKELVEVSPGKKVCFKCQAKTKKEKVLGEIFR